tara:strand:+ start:176 stop:283 length:108 start_codon:yes stop_codon:yes gene_type:complete
MLREILRRVWQFFTQEEGMTWERYHRNMEERRKEK